MAVLGDVSGINTSDTTEVKQAKINEIIVKVGGQTHKLDETATPTAIPDVGQIYTKNDNKLYFQTGAGLEKEIAFVV